MRLDKDRERTIMARLVLEIFLRTFNVSLFE